jgi:hypothetical protein
MSMIVGASPVAGGYWTSRAELEFGFGATAVASWADLDGTEDSQKISDTVQYWVINATDDAKTRLRGSSWWPIQVPGPMLRMQTTRLCAAMLYTGKGVRDSADEDGKHRLKWAMDQAVKWFDSVVANKIRLTDAVTGVSRVPIVGQQLKPFGSQFGPLVDSTQQQQINQESELGGIVGFNLWWDGFNAAQFNNPDDVSQLA